MPSLSWSVAKDKDGKFVRRGKDEQGNLFSEDHIDVVWTHTKGFPPGHTLQMVEGKEIKKATPPVKEIKDQLVVPTGTDDKVIEGLLNGKRKKLAESLGVEE